MKPASIDRRAHPPGAIFSSWSAPDGWPIRRMHWPQTPAGKPRGSVIFLGGRGDFIEKYLEPLGHWHAEGWDVTSFDWRSQGGSRGDIKNGHIDNFGALLKDITALVAHWFSTAPGPHVAVGHSMGGHLLLRLLAEERPALSAAVLVAPMIGINSAPMPPWMGQAVAQTLTMFGWNTVPAWRQSGRPAPAGSARQSFLTSCGERYSDELWWIDREPGYALGAPSWGWLNAAYASMARLTPERLAKVETPVLVIGAERDRLVSAAAIRSAAAALPRAELLMFPDAAHEILRESDEVRLEALARIDRFLAEHAAA